MITKILVPIDFSMCSKNALVFALQLADTIKADLRLLTVLDFDGSDMENTAYAHDVMEERKVQSKNRIIKFIEKTTEKCSCIS